MKKYIAVESTSIEAANKIAKKEGYNKLIGYEIKNGKVWAFYGYGNAKAKVVRKT